MGESDNIIYCEADSNYTHIHLKNSRKITVTKTLKVYEELLSPSKFHRIHQSYLVNLNCIIEYIKGEGETFN
ncbi:MAG: LytTR family transcriptional regulator [Flavobacteriales bacterium]|nr:LytTR family transcriptional regulator [Flavobacteriales bacterium]